MALLILMEYSWFYRIGLLKLGIRNTGVRSRTENVDGSHLYHRAAAKRHYSVAGRLECAEEK